MKEATGRAGKGFYELAYEHELFARLDSMVTETERLDALEMFALKGVISEAHDSIPDPREYDDAFYLLEILREEARERLDAFAKDFIEAYRTCNEAIERKEYRERHGKERSIYAIGSGGNPPSEEADAL